MKAFLSAALVVGLVSCSLAGCWLDHRSYIEPADSWYNELPSSDIRKFRSKGELKQSYFSVVVPAMQNKAMGMLEKNPTVRLEKTTAASFCENPLNLKQALQQGKKAFLVRGVLLNEGTGGYSVYLSGNTLWVEHDSLGHSPVRMQRQALIVYLDSQPTRVFVTCSMAE